MNHEVKKISEVTKTPADAHPSEVANTSGTVSKLLYNVHGDCDGFILDGEKQIHFPPHLSAEVLKGVKPGDKVQIHGKKLLPVGLTIAASISLPDGSKIVDNGPPQKPHQH